MASTAPKRAGSSAELRARAAQIRSDVHALLNDKAVPRLSADLEAEAEALERKGRTSVWTNAGRPGTKFCEFFIQISRGVRGRVAPEAKRDCGLDTLRICYTNATTVLRTEPPRMLQASI